VEGSQTGPAQPPRPLPLDLTPDRGLATSIRNDHRGEWAQVVAMSLVNGVLGGLILTTLVWMLNLAILPSLLAATLVAGILLAITLRRIIEQSNDSLLIEDEGITLNYKSRQRFVAWSQLSPPTGPLPLGCVVFGVKSPAGPEREKLPALVVTPAQARAILTSPACPRWPVEWKVLRGLGVSSAD
jgi:hypothetical protein